MLLSVVLIGTLSLHHVPLKKLNERTGGLLTTLAKKGCVLLFLENLFSFLGTQLSVHLIARNYCRKNFGDLFRLSRKILLTDVSEKRSINCLLKVGGSGSDIPEIIFVIQLLK